MRLLNKLLPERHRVMLRVVTPHGAGVAIFLTGLAFLGDIHNPLLRLGIGTFSAVGLSLCVWVGTVRAVEYYRLYKDFKSSNPDEYGTTLGELVIQGLDNLANAMQSSTVTVQGVNGCRGKKRVLAHAMFAANTSYKNVAETRQVVDDNHLTNFMGTSIGDYLWPGW